MVGIIGIIFVFVMVFGGYLLHGGSIGVILAALPTELMTILGGATGALIIGNTAGTIKAVGGGLGYMKAHVSETVFGYMGSHVSNIRRREGAS